MAMWLYGWEHLILGNNTDNLRGFRYCGSGDKMILIAIRFQKPMRFKGLCEFTVRSPL